MHPQIQVWEGLPEELNQGHVSVFYVSVLGHSGQMEEIWQILLSDFILYVGFLASNMDTGCLVKQKSGLWKFVADGSVAIGNPLLYCLLLHCVSCFTTWIIHSAPLPAPYNTLPAPYNTLTSLTHQVPFILLYFFTQQV